MKNKFINNSENTDPRRIEQFKTQFTNILENSSKFPDLNKTSNIQLRRMKSSADFPQQSGFSIIIMNQELHKYNAVYSELVLDILNNGSMKYKSEKKQPAMVKVDIDSKNTFKRIFKQIIPALAPFERTTIKIPYFKQDSDIEGGTIQVEVLFKKQKYPDKPCNYQAPLEYFLVNKQ